MKYVIFDCDNTLGLADCDVDDGLALIYLLGKENIQLCAVTTTYGNSDLDRVQEASSALLRELGRADIALFRGCADKNSGESEAAEFLAAAVKERPGEFSLLATGSLTNLYAAYRLNPGFFHELRELVLMGGITETLEINGHSLDELNFACHPEAAACVLQNAPRLSVITGNNCLPAYFPLEDFQRRLSGGQLDLQRGQRPIAAYIRDKCNYWFENMTRRFGIDGFHNWDVVAAAYLARPDLFQDQYRLLDPRLPELAKGRLTFTTSEGSGRAIPLNLPRIADPEQFMEEVYNAWLSVDI